MICLIAAITSCNNVATQNDSIADTMAQFNTDTTAGIKIDSANVKSVADSVKNVN